MKVIALVAAGRQATLRVPREQRRWMQLLYDQSKANRPTSAIALRACRRSGTQAAQRRECGWVPRVACRSKNTQFAGGFSIAFGEAPLRGRCAELVVLVPGRPPMRELLFERDRERCAATVALWPDGHEGPRAKR